MRVTVIQMSPSASAQSNCSQAAELIGRACAEEKPDLVVLPEVWSCLGGTREEKRRAAEILPNGAISDAGPLYQFLRRTAVDFGVAVHGGSIGEKSGDRLYNTSLVFDRNGVEIARYRKIHLFDVETPAGERYCESDLYDSGIEVVTCEVGDMVVGCTICYDLRFGYLFEALREAGSHLIVVPAAFTAETGRAHWEILVRARAIETQSWVAACGTTGPFFDGDGKPRSTFGHSMICDPWGRIVASIGDGPGWASAVIDRELTGRVRQSMPVWEHRRALAQSSGMVLGR